ncbi:MAG: hypothetical protein NZM38_08580 [Cytophagales bacterium]|nr:hypothetical protein [Cytophagales bacterium]MDW8384814.1 hypothetical protein [Flammeovirgaceae bacterium]
MQSFCAIRWWWYNSQGVKKLISRAWIVFVVLFCHSWLMAQETFEGEVDSVDMEVLFFQFQTAKKKVLLAGHAGMGLGFRNLQFTLENSTALLDGYFSPRIGYFWANRWVAGLNFEFTTSIISFNYYNLYSFNSNTFGIFGRYYFPSAFFLEADYGRGIMKEKSYQYQLLTQHSFCAERIGVGIGIGNFWFKKFAFELLCKFNNLISHNKLHFHNLSITAGLAYSIGRK